MDKAVREAVRLNEKALRECAAPSVSSPEFAVWEALGAAQAAIAAQATDLAEVRTAYENRTRDYYAAGDAVDYWKARAEAAEAQLAQAVAERDGVRELLAGCRVVLDGLRTVSGTNGEKKYDCAESRGGSLVNVASVIKRIDELLAARAAGGREGVA